MKRQAEDSRVSEHAPRASKRPRRENVVLPSHKQSSELFQLDGKDVYLGAWIKLKKDCSNHKCVTQVTARFCLQRPGQETMGTHIGDLIAQTINRAVLDPDRPYQTLFVSEMLDKGQAVEGVDRPMKHGVEGEDETELIMQHLFHRDGTPREDYARKSLRGAAPLHFIAEFELKPAYRGRGLAKRAMHTYLRGIQRVGEGHSFRGTVILSPAALPQAPGRRATGSCSRPAKTLVEIERALIASYEKAGFGVWTQGDDNLEGLAITIMGMTIVGPKFRQLRTQPLSLEEVAAAETAVVMKRVDSVCAAHKSSAAKTACSKCSRG